VVNAKRLWLPLVVVAIIPAGHYLIKSVRQNVSAPALSAPDVNSTFAGPVVPQTISLNAAGEAELVAISGIGTKFAQNILAARPPEGFANWDEVDSISGVGPARLRQLQERFTLP
jgi:DNA uptake protein ComE-like DNA-binding protein